MDYNKILDNIDKYVVDFFLEGNCANLCFHNEEHTKSVVAATEELSDHYKLSEEDRFVVLAAAYLHDLGYASGGAKYHEDRSVIIAKDFLLKEQIPAEIINKVEACILATRIPQSPKNLLEEIICDADLYHFGTSAFMERNKLMHVEAEKETGLKIEKNFWRSASIQLLEKHHYHTGYAHNKLNAGKRENIKALQKKKNKSEVESKSNRKPERGIETMFRITASNSQRLSDMADNKANILLTVNSIILSLVVSVLLRSLDKNTHLILPTIILMTVVLAVMVLAILSTIPKIPNGYFTEEQVQKKSVNLLFFGNFYKMPIEKYSDSMNKAMDDYDFLYGMMTKDVYSQGVVLGRKYKLLRYAYGTFMFGLILSVLTFVIAILYL